MEPERWAQIKQILGTYLDLNADERACYLAQSCEGDATLLADVQHLLDSDAALGDFLETPLFGACRPSGSETQQYPGEVR